MQSLLYVKGSDGSANASLMTVQTLRNALATTMIVNTTTGVPAGGFYATMGTPHTFTDPQTGETITVVSDATAVDFAGHITGGNVIIDAIAPGYTDLGSKVGDIIMIRPITEWANNLYNVLNQVHNADGSLKTDSIPDATPFADPVDPVLRQQDFFYDFVKPGGVVWSGDSYGSTRNASMTAGIIYINGNRYTVNAVTARAFTASKDTYVDAPIPASGQIILNSDLVYTEVANNAASPALAANRVRIGIVITGASNIANASAINQGQPDKVLPIASSIPYTVTDSLGNLICPRDPARRIIGYRSGNYAISSATYADIVGLNLVCNIPDGRKVRVGIYSPQAYVTGAVTTGLQIVDVTAGATVQDSNQNMGNTVAQTLKVESPLLQPAGGARNYKVQGKNASATFNLPASTTFYVELV